MATITGPATETGVASIVWDEITDDLAATDWDGMTANANGIMLEFTVTVTITTAADDADTLWYVDEAAGASALTDSYAFTVYVMEPCTESAIVYDTYEFTVSMAIGDTADDSSVATMTAHTYYTYCDVTQTFYDGGCSDCTHATATASGSDDTEVTFTIDPTDATSSVGTYTLVLESCYTNFPSVCSDPIYVYVTITSPCLSASFTALSVSNPSAISVFAASSAITLDQCTSTDTDSVCGVSGTFALADDDTPNLIEITQFSDLTSVTSTDRQVTLTSTDWSDIGTHTYK